MLPRAGSPKLDLLWKGHSETLLSWAAPWARQRSTQLGAICKLLRVHTTPLSVAPMEMLKSIGRSTDPKGQHLLPWHLAYA